MLGPFFFGRFVKSQVTINGKVQFKPRLAAGGHGQAGMDLLDKYGIKYNIVKTYPNGVRVGNVPGHKKSSKQKGIGQSWFPKDWTGKDIKRAGSHVASLKGNRHMHHTDKRKNRNGVPRLRPDFRSKQKEKEKMSIVEEYKSIVQRLELERKNHLDELPNYEDVSMAIKPEIALFTRNLRDTVEFLDNDCTADQLSWMSEVFEDISAILQSWEFIDALKRAADRFPEECKIYNIRECILFAEGQLNDEVYRQRYPDFGK